MDAQNAPGSDKTKPAASPTRAGGPQTDDTRDAASKSSVKVDAVADEGGKPILKDNNPSVGETARKSPKPPRSPQADAKPGPDSTARSVTVTDRDDDVAPADRDSDAETIVLPGKDGHSPSKARKVKHEDRSDGEAHVSRKSRDGLSGKLTGRDEKVTGGADSARPTPPTQPKKKLLVDKDLLRSEKLSRVQDGSSGLSSAPASPPEHQRRRNRPTHDSDSDSDSKRNDRNKSNKLRAKSTDQVLSSQKRKAYRADSGDEAEERKAARRRRLDDRGDWVSKGDRPAHRDGKNSHKDERSLSAKWHPDSANRRSVSPPARAHRRSISTQLPGHTPANGLGQKKKRLPPPLRSTEYHSDDSSASGSPHPRNSKVRKMSTPGDANPSPAKLPISKKHVDAHGQTPLARACNKGEYEVAKRRLAERPDDLNVADYAGNTPLQSAAINGYEDIVKLLIGAGCNLDCVNQVKDTPLLDAVDNGHLGVVKLLLDAGVNPRKANVEGEEPLDRVSDDLENAADIRGALLEAKQKHAEVRRTSEDHPENDARSSNGPDSPRRSPGPTSLSRRATVGRANKTGNHHLYVNLDAKTLRAAAARGDEETVTRVLQVRDNCDDPAAMVAAARGGHEVVLELLLAIGGANPDPGPVRGIAQEVGTPMLAAIGQENLNVIKLLLNQQNFDPTRRFRGDYYHEIARRRQGPNWKDEEQILKDAFDAHRKSSREGKTKSPGRRDREKAQDRESKRVSRNVAKEARSHQRNLSSPTGESEPKKTLASGRAVTSPKENRKSDSSSHPDEQTSPKRAAARPKKEERTSTITVSDREASPALSNKHAAKPKRVESDMAGLSSENETVKPRRKLVSKGELRGEREKQRRASMVSNASSLKDPSRPRDPKPDDNSDKPSKAERLSEKYHDRTKALKGDESRDRLSVSGDNPSKRHRSSVTPPHADNGDKDSAEAPSKRRRLDAEGKERRSKAVDPTPDDSSKPLREGQSKSKSAHREAEPENRKHSLKPSVESSDHQAPEQTKPSIHVKSEDVDVEMPDVPASAQVEESEARRKKEREEEIKKRREVEAADARAKDEAQREREKEKKRREEEETKRREEEQKRREAAEEEKKQKEKERQRLAEEERLKREAEEAEKKRREEQEAAAAAAAEAERRREEEERQKREEEKRRAEEEEKERKRIEEEQRQREEEERLHREQLEREAAEQAQRQREEEERKEREHREQLKREEAERKRAAHEAELRRLREEQERQQRLAKLPPLLRWLDGCANPQLSQTSARFKRLQGVRFDTIRPEASGTPEGREQWVLNVQVALFLGVKDLELSRYTAWERIPVSDLAKTVIWRLEADRYALTAKELCDLRSALPDYYGPGKEHRMDFRNMERIREEAHDKFMQMDMFFIKLSELLYIIPNFPHLRNLKLSVEYREVPESEKQLFSWELPQKWKSDPDADRFYGFAPRSKYYVNGVLVGEQKPGLSATSKEPFPESRVPRRCLQRVFPDDPEYAKLCKEQGLDHLLNGQTSPSVTNGAHPSPVSQTHELQSATDVKPEQPAPSATGSSSQPQPLANGIHETGSGAGAGDPATD